MSTAPCAPPREHQLVIIDVVGPGRNAAGRMPQPSRGPGLTSTPVLCISQTDDVEERIRFLEAGADDVIARPFDARELEARVEALLLRFQRSRDLTAASRTRTRNSRGGRKSWRCSARKAVWDHDHRGEYGDPRQSAAP